MIEFTEVTKKYKSFKALDNLSLAIPQGEITGLIGRNGAGKTTIMKTITGLITHYTGNVHVNIQSNSSMGFSPEMLSLYGLQSVNEFLVLIAKIRGVPKQEYKTYIHEMLDLFELEQYKSKFIKNLSKGNLQKLSFIQAFIHLPQLVLLDEPTSGIDPIAKKAMFDYVRSYSQNNNAIVISSHRLDELEKLCDYFIIIDSGKTLTMISSEELKKCNLSLEDYFVKQLKVLL